MISASEIQTAIDAAAADGFEMVGLEEMWPHLSERARAHIFAQRAELWPFMTPAERSGTMWMDTAEANLRRHQRDEAARGGAPVTTTAELLGALERLAADRPEAP